MMRSLLSTIIVAISLAVAPLASGQALWLTAGVRGDVNKRVTLLADADYRTHSGMKSTERVMLTVGADYKIAPWLKVGGSLVWMESHAQRSTSAATGIVSEPYSYLRYRTNLTALGTYKIGPVAFSVREIYMYTHRAGAWVNRLNADGEAIDPTYKRHSNSHIIRSRVQADYAIPGTRLTPYISYEWLNKCVEGFGVDQTRASIGASYKLNPHNSLTLSYRYIDRRGNTDYSVIHAAYTYRFSF